MHIHFPYYNQTIECPNGTTVLEACTKSGHPLSADCKGNGTCGQCSVIIESEGIKAKVLACQYPVENDLSILISPDCQAEKQFNDTLICAPIIFDPPIGVYPVATEALVPAPAGYWLDTLRDLLPIQLNSLSYSVLKKLDASIQDQSQSITTIITHNHNIIDCVSAPIPTPCLGIAFDIGTTTVAGYLYNLEDGQYLATGSASNGQRIFGADVISRINYANESYAHQMELQSAITQTLSDIIEDVLNQVCAKPEMIYAVTVAGNSTMIHLLLGLTVTSLGIAPFTAISKDQVILSGNVLHLPVNPHCQLTVLPTIGGFVGSDTTALLAALPKDDQKRLIIDLGTNGELAIGENDNYTVASTACGPALEGNGLTFGMRGISGAIDHVTVSSEGFNCHVIGDSTAVGICGSGIVDTIAALLNVGLLKPDGAFISGSELKEHHLSHFLTMDSKGQRHFTLLPSNQNPGGEAITISQKDIRAVQMAIAAIRTGWQCLLKKTNTQPDNLNEVVLAGAFGHHMDIHSAQLIGLVPSFSKVQVQSMGNGAGIGVQHALLSAASVKRCTQISECGKHLDLATDSEFNSVFLYNMDFKSIFN